MPRTLAALTVCLLLAACTDESSRSAAPAPGQAAGEPGLAVAELTGGREAATQADSAAPAPPARPVHARAVLDRSATRQELARWAEDSDAGLDVRLTALRRLEAEGSEQAFATAEALLAQSPGEAQLKANAVALLARSGDPRADALIARQEPRYQRLARVLRERGREK